MKTSKVNFTSNIRFVDSLAFAKELDKLPSKKYVDSPWKVKNIVRGISSYTDDVRDCTAGGVLTNNKNNGFDIIMFHLNSTDEENLSFTAVENKIFEKLGKDKPLEGFLIGSQSAWDDSIELFAKMEAFIQRLKVPYSKFQGSIINQDINAAYHGESDMWTIFYSALEKSHGRPPREKIFSSFDKIIISKKDRLWTQ